MIRKLFIIFLVTFFSKNAFAKDGISNAEKIALVAEKYEVALSLCNTIKRSKRELAPEDLKVLMALTTSNFSAFIKNKSMMADKICLIDNGAPPLMVVESLKNSLVGSDRLIIENFLRLISIPYSDDLFFKYSLIKVEDRERLDSMSYFKKPFDMIYIADLVLDRQN